MSNTYYTCCYDNPNTMCKEYYLDGELQKSITIELLYSNGIPSDLKFITGKLEGDMRALPDELFKRLNKDGTITI